MSSFDIAFSPSARYVVFFEEPTGLVECVDVINDASCDRLPYDELLMA